MNKRSHKQSFVALAFTMCILILSQGNLCAQDTDVEATRGMPNPSGKLKTREDFGDFLAHPENEYLYYLTRFASYVPSLPLDVVLATTQEEFKDWDRRYNLTFQNYFIYRNFTSFVKEIPPSVLIKSCKLYPMLSAKEKAFFLAGLYICLNDDNHKLNGTQTIDSTYILTQALTNEERDVMYDFLRQHVDDTTQAFDPFQVTDAEMLWQDDLRDAFILLQKLIDSACKDLNMPLIAYNQITGRTSDPFWVYTRNEYIDSTPDLVLYSIMRFQLNLLRRNLNQYYPYLLRLLYYDHRHIFIKYSAGPKLEEYYTALRIFDEYLDLQFIATRNGVTEGVINGIVRQEETTLGQIAQRLLDALEEPVVLKVPTQYAFVTSAQDVDSESLASLISSVTDDNVLPLDLILSIVKTKYHTDAFSTASTQPIKLSPRYDYNYDDFTNFYRFFEKALLASKDEVLECVAQADAFTLRQRAFLLAALYLRQQTRPASGGLFYEGKLGSYFLKDATLDELTPNEAQLISEFVTKCETNDTELLFPRDPTLHTPNDWEESFRKNAKRLQSVLVVDPILPKADAPYWQKFYNEASLEDIYFVLMFETDVTTQRLLTSASAKEKEKLYKPLPADEVVVTQEEAQLSDKERYFETRMARAFLLTQPIIQGFRHIDKAEPQLKTVHTLHDMTTVLPIIPTVTK